MTQYVYQYSQQENLFTVGFYDPSGAWHAESDHNTREHAAERVHWLNGGDERKPKWCGGPL